MVINIIKKIKIFGVKAGRGLLFITKFNDAFEVAKLKMINDPYFF